LTFLPVKACFLLVVVMVVMMVVAVVVVMVVVMVVGAVAAVVVEEEDVAAKEEEEVVGESMLWTSRRSPHLEAKEPTPSKDAHAFFLWDISRCNRIHNPTVSLLEHLHERKLHRFAAGSDAEISD
jgi:hypothetical protein